MDTAQTSSFSIQPAELSQLVQIGAAPLILDVRRSAAFDASPHMLQGAQRCLPEHIDAFATSMPAREVIVYCVYGHQVGKEAAARLRELGWQARYLAGGICGGEDGVDAPDDVAAWRSVRLPVEAKSA